MITLTLVILLYSFTSVIALSRLRQTIPQVSYYSFLEMLVFRRGYCCNFKVSSLNSDFNYDFNTSFTEEQ